MPNLTLAQPSTTRAPKIARLGLDPIKVESSVTLLTGRSTRWEENSWLSKLALVLVRFDHIASMIVNAEHKILPFTLSSPRFPCSEKT